MSFSAVFKPLLESYATALETLDVTIKDRAAKVSAAIAADTAVADARAVVDRARAAIDALVADVSDEDGYNEPVAFEPPVPALPAPPAEPVADAAPVAEPVETDEAAFQE